MLRGLGECPQPRDNITIILVLGITHNCPSGAVSAVSCYARPSSGCPQVCVPLDRRWSYLLGDHHPIAAGGPGLTLSWLGGPWLAPGCAEARVTENDTISATTFTEQMWHSSASLTNGSAVAEPGFHPKKVKMNAKRSASHTHTSKIHLSGRGKAWWRILYTDTSVLQKTINLVTRVGGVEG